MSHFTCLEWLVSGHRCWFQLCFVPSLEMTNGSIDVAPVGRHWMNYVTASAGYEGDCAGEKVFTPLAWQPVKWPLYVHVPGHSNPPFLCMLGQLAAACWCMMLNGQLTGCPTVKKEHNLSFPDNIMKCLYRNSVTHEIWLMRFSTREVISCVTERITKIQNHFRYENYYSLCCFILVFAVRANAKCICWC